MWHADIGFKVICTLWLNGKWESEGVLPSKSLSREEDTGVRGSGSGSPPSASSTESFFSSRKLSFSVTKPRERKLNSSSAVLRWKLGVSKSNERIWIRRFYFHFFLSFFFLFILQALHQPSARTAVACFWGRIFRSSAQGISHSLVIIIFAAKVSQLSGKQCRRLLYFYYLLPQASSCLGLPRNPV